MFVLQFFGIEVIARARGFFFFFGVDNGFRLIQLSVKGQNFQEKMRCDQVSVCGVSNVHRPIAFRLRIH